MTLYSKNMRPVEQLDNRKIKKIETLQFSSKDGDTIFISRAIYKVRPILIIASTSGNRGDYAKYISWREYFKLRGE